ncbi:MAG: cobalamin biosynthesis bifunctional protein CbiET [Alteromonadaceae bacterium]|nr:MAG: cobalamin biosynthesis bifunctional protein CbiET [Alteromonadaceae bacterium]
MPKPVIHVIGLGVSQSADLSHEALKALQSSQQVIGWERHQAIISPLLKADAKLFVVVQKLSQLKTEIDTFLSQLQSQAPKQAQSICILASGDPLHYGIGRWLCKQFDRGLLHFYPAISSIQAACHKQALALQDVCVVSLHGRPLAKIRTQLKRNRTLVILSDANSQPQALAQECLKAGFELSQITVHENLGYEQERSRTFKASALSQYQENFEPLHVSIIEVGGEGGILPEFPGIPDHHYITGEVPGKGMISKREVRLTILSYLQAAKDDVIWDIGAGCGGVAVELSHWNEHCEVYAIEHHPQRLKYLTQNRDKFGVVQNLHIIAGTAPQALSDLPRPNKIFIGGSDGELASLLKLSWEALPLGGLLVASAVMASTQTQLHEFALQLEAAQVESIELSVKRGELHEKQWRYVPKLPVHVFKFVKLVNFVNGGANS